ncbi:MAG TPA: TIGR00159 family protein [Candidatus Scybalocola faecavium]|nr:TIGR00159 family protein [Candidatus Scybalocola faecavium]
MFSWLSVPSWGSFRITNVIEILILAFLIYQVFKWIKNTRAWTLFKGIIVVIGFAVLAYLLNLTTILWIFARTFNVVVIAIFILFQPELRRALEQLGRKRIVGSLFSSSGSSDRLPRETEKCHEEIIKAVFDMAKVKTGALIVVERQVVLSEYERTGIPLDAQVSSQLLINIFEHNTPLHDGAVFIRNNRIVAATCYLPLSENEKLSKALGTRHRAGVGISEISDCITIIVSEETGFVSVARDGVLHSHLTVNELRRELQEKKKTDGANSRFRKLKGILKNEKKADQ